MPNTRHYPMSTIFRDATYERQIRTITQTMEPRIRASFIRAMQDIKDRAQMGRLRDALRSGDIAAAVDALNIEPAALADLQSLIVETYGRSGAATIQSGTWIYPDGTRAVVRWNALSPRSEAWARQLGADLIQGDITEQTRQAARDTIADGYAFGRSPDRIARDLVGRIGANGKRQGGIIGLDDPSQQWVRNLRGYLDEDPKRALSMKLNARDKQFIRRLLKDGRQMSQSQIDGMLRRYENNLLMVRGRRIARTETQNAIEAGRYEAWKQGLEKTGVPERFVTRTWVHTGRAVMDRPDHMAFSGSQMSGLTMPFVLPSGAQMRHSHDTELGAGAKDVINCECRTDYKLDRKALRNWYESQV